MRTPRLLIQRTSTRHLGALALLAAAGCHEVQALDETSDTAGEASALASCGVAAPAHVVALRATPRGVVLATSADGAAPADGAMPADAEVVVQRLRGDGCALAPVGAPVAAGTLLDVDDHENLYVLPAEARDDDVVSTMLPGEYPGSMAARVDLDGGVVKMLPAVRGIWELGVAPEGDALWVSACGPTGIYAIDGDVVAPSMTPPDTLWEQSTAVLTDASTFWSVGIRTCDPTAPLTVDCGFALVRATPEGSREVGTTLATHDGVVERATLARCGDGVCGVFSTAVTWWSPEGAVVRTITLADAGASPGEHIVAASGNRAGVYLLLAGDGGRRVRFVPHEVAVDHGR